MKTSPGLSLCAAISALGGTPGAGTEIAVSQDRWYHNAAVMSARMPFFSHASDSLHAGSGNLQRAGMFCGDDA